MATNLEIEKKNVISSWDEAIRPYTVSNVLYRNVEGMNTQMRREIKQLSKEGYMRVIKLGGTAISLGHSNDRLFVDDFKGGIYYFFEHEIAIVELLLSSKIKPGVLTESKGRASIKRCLVNAGFDESEARDIISMRLKMDTEMFDVRFTDIRRKTQ
ncbi:MAG: hypothetical protein M1603_01770 [Candidatus Marsarchaeota archaeon]|jgi:hypothetical protein|nr:hypothetical protein [Candidatus Marsarchaeota archaeon]